MRNDDFYFCIFNAQSSSHRQRRSPMKFTFSLSAARSLALWAPLKNGRMQPKEKKKTLTLSDYCQFALHAAFIHVCAEREREKQQKEGERRNERLSQPTRIMLLGSLFRLYYHVLFVDLSPFASI